MRRILQNGAKHHEKGPEEDYWVALVRCLIPVCFYNGSGVYERVLDTKEQ